MKLNKLFAIFAMVAAVAFAACNTVPEGPDGPGPSGNDTTVVNPPAGEDVDWSDANLPEGAITCAKAREIASALESGVVTSETYYVYGIVKKFGSKHADGIAQYGNATFYMVDKQGDSDDFEAYQVYNLNKEKYTSEDQIAVGDRVVVCCHITNYNGTYETAGKGDGYVYWSSNPKAGITTGGGEENPNPDVTNDGSEAHPFTAADVIALNNTKTGNYYVKAYIVGQVKAGATSAANNCEFAAPFTANDNGANSNMLVAAAATGATESNVVFVQLPTGAVRDGLNVVQNEGNLGKEVLLYGSLEKYFGGVGVKNVSYAVIDGQELGVKPGTTFTEPESTVATVAEFLAVADNSTVPGVYYELTGTIGGTINTTYGNFDLTDATGTVYVYGLTASYIVLSSATKATNDKSFATLNLKEGDNVTIRGCKTTYTPASGDPKIEVLGAYFVRKN